MSRHPGSHLVPAGPARSARLRPAQLRSNPIRAAGALLLLAPAAASQVTAVKAPPHTPLGPFAAPVDYLGQDLREEEWTNLGVVPVRPMALTPDDAHLYAVNTHDSTVVWIDFAGGAVLESWRVPWGPVSVAVHDTHPDGTPRLLVVSQGNHALTILERLSGRYLEVLELPFEPADLLVAGNVAWISCSGADLVARLDLVTLELRELPIPAKHPVYLAFDPDGSVLVAPQISGNNSKAFGSPVTILDLDDRDISPDGLPDEDTFRIDPASGSVTAVARQMGTDLFALGINPATLHLWQLNLEALNKDPAKQSEPAIQGHFAQNRLTITQLSAPGGPPVGKAGHAFIDLDDSDPLAPGVQYDPARTVGGPTGLSFSSAGYGLITGATTDNVTVRAPSGAQGEGTFVLEFDVPAGSIPRQALFDPATENLILVYCWGTNRIETFTALGIPVPGLGFDLGFDPTPAIVRQGRELFHDAGRSQNNNLTCGSCHVEGRTDQLAWDLSNAPLDMKGPMVTQTFKGIDRLAPYHWRGERPELRDFNTAFPDLLGGALLNTAPGGEFDRFQAYIFSLRATANPGQDERNLVSDTAGGVEGNGIFGHAVRGQERFVVVNPPVPGVGQQALAPRPCVACHAHPMATVGDLVIDNAQAIPQRGFVEVPGFNEMWRKEQPVVSVVINGTPTKSALIGSGFQHDGELPDLFAFMQQFSITEQTRSDITAFVRQFPSGVAPAAHKAILLDQAHLGAEARLRDYFIDQAERGFVDLVAYGTFPDALGVIRPFGWLYDPQIDKFRADDGSLQPVRINLFVKQAQLGKASVLFHGLVPGNGRRAALDHDRDGLLNQDEAFWGVDPLDPDSDGDLFPDGYEVQNGSDPDDAQSLPNDVTPPALEQLELRWVTAKNASVRFETTEPTTFRVDYDTPQGSGPQTVLGAEPSRMHTALLRDLLPSTSGVGVNPGEEVFHDYTGTLTVTDLAGLTASLSLPAFQSGSFAITFALPRPAVIADLRTTSVVKQAGTLDVAGTITMHVKQGGPPPEPAGNMVAAFNVVVNGAVWSDITTTLPQSFKQLGVPYTALPGPWVMTLPTDPATGQTGWLVRVNGVAPGDEVVFNPALVQYTNPATYDPQNPNFGQLGVNPVPSVNYAFADTPAELRSVSVTF